LHIDAITKQINMDIAQINFEIFLAANYNYNIYQNLTTTGKTSNK